MICLKYFLHMLLAIKCFYSFSDVIASSLTEEWSSSKKQKARILKPTKHIKATYLQNVAHAEDPLEDILRGMPLRTLDSNTSFQQKSQIMKDQEHKGEKSIIVACESEYPIKITQQNLLLILDHKKVIFGKRSACIKEMPDLSLLARIKIEPSIYLLIGGIHQKDISERIGPRMRKSTWIGEYHFYKDNCKISDKVIHIEFRACI